MCNKNLQNALCSDDSSSPNHPNFGNLLWSSSNSYWRWWTLSPGSVLPRTKRALMWGTAKSWPVKTTVIKCSETEASLPEWPGFLSHTFPASHLLQVFRFLTRQCGPVARTLDRKWGRTAFLSWSWPLAYPAVGPHFSVLLARNDSVPNSIVTLCPFPLGDYIRMLIYENKLCSGPWAFLRTVLYKYEIPFVIVCSPGDLRKEVESQRCSFL